MDKKESDFDEILDDLFKVGAEKLRRMGQEKVQNRCNVETSRDTNHESDNLFNFPIFSATNKFYSKCEQDDDSKEDQEEDGDDGDTFDMWDITVEDVERIRKFFNVPDEIDEIPYRLYTCGGAWIPNKLRGSIANRTSWMLYRWLVKLPVMVDVAQRSRLGSWLRACCLFIFLRKSKGVFRSNSTLVLKFSFP
ncbi:hypothetical protein Tco_0875359 [Tanacetum coccineum]|uniref:Uncharacterized protein n=1 Tax=Tanacetum coccineum TaxID=301880 RepID=A0ABQ5BSR2_9ASTR